MRGAVFPDPQFKYNVIEIPLPKLTIYGLMARRGTQPEFVNLTPGWA